MLDDILQINHIMRVELEFTRDDGERRVVGTWIGDEDMFMPVPEMDDHEKEFFLSATPEESYESTTLALFEPLAEMIENAGFKLKAAHFGCSNISVGIVLCDPPFKAKIVFGGGLDEGETDSMPMYDVVHRCVMDTAELQSVLMDGRLIPILDAIRRDRSIFKYKEIYKYMRRGYNAG